MLKTRMLTGGLIALFAGAGPLPAQRVADRWTAAAERFVRYMAAGEYEAAAVMISADVPVEALSAERLGEIWMRVTAASGPLTALAPVSIEETNGLRRVDLRATFDRQEIVVRVVLDARERISGLWFLPPAPPPYSPPAYVDTAAIIEQDVVIGDAPWSLPGTLTLPRGATAVPGIVIVHGSGPIDRDGTVGPNRPYRDLAWGLASAGIAVLRYDKRTRVHGARMSGPITVEDEVIADALAALDSLRADPRVSDDRVYVAGHSLGGMLAPTIAGRDARLAGVILLAAPARSIETLLAEQLRYVADLEGTPAARAQELRAIADTVDLLRARSLPPDANVMGAPASYYYDLARYDPLVAVRSLDTPFLVIQGGRDYQVTSDDFARWRTALADRGDAAVLRTFPSLNHLFIAGSGTRLARPEEYATGSGHVDAGVIDAIAGFVRQPAPAERPPPPGAPTRPR